MCTFKQAREYIHLRVRGILAHTKGDNVQSNRHTTALDGCLDRSTYHLIWRERGRGETASSESKNTASTHLQQNKLETVNYRAKLKAYEMSTWAHLRVKQQYAECKWGLG